MQVFERDIRVSRAPAREAETDIKPRFSPAAAELDEADAVQPAEGEAKELNRASYAVDSGAGSHDWELDLCAVTLANFNYRKMTLVRDYTELIGSFAYNHANFDRLFSDEGRPVFEPNAQADGDYAVLAADPSQAEAVARASAGDSYVIQGPPGTGKSQTITNLIADYVARGKGVLFVCEKRAALDVVFHRLKQTGLGDVSTLIHDSQGDKKAFIEELKVIYEAWTSNIAKHRQAVTSEIASRLAELERFSSAMTADIEPVGPPLRDLIEERLKYGGELAADAPAPIRAALPGWQAFQAAKPVTQMLRDALIASGYDGVLARAPVRLPRSDEDIVADLKNRHGDLRRLNSQFAVNARHQGFRSDVTRSNEPTVGLRREERDWRQDFRRGRKTLENEFQKSRVYKSIRELFAGEAGRALRRLKPVWLMSPFERRRHLPLEESLFDVVIFDEASQIPLEDASTKR